MRKRTWVAVMALLLALGLGFTGRALDSTGLDTAAGLLWIVAIVAALLLLPFWNRILPALAPMPGLFDTVGEDQRWCSHCGSPTPQEGPCQVCARDPPTRRAIKA